MKLLHRLHEGGQTVTLCQRLRERVFGLEQREQLVQVLVEDRAQYLLRQSLGRRVDWQRLSGRATTVVVAGAGDDILARRDLAPVEESHGPGHEEQIALADRAVEERLAGPRRLYLPRAVAQHCLEDAQARASRQDALRHDLADDGRVLADLDLADARDRAHVLVPTRHMEEQVASRADVEPRKQLRALRADAL